MAGAQWSVDGKTAVITGATSGLGRLAALALAERGARLYLVCRNAGLAERVAAEITRDTGNPDVRVVIADLSVQGQVRRAAHELLATGDPIHVLVNNAGAMFGSRRQVSQDGIEMTFALNHLAYFTMTVLLLDRLRDSAPARIVNVASDAYKSAKGGFDFEDVNAEVRYSAFRQYAMSKLANILFTRALARRLDGSGVTANAAAPPRLTATGFARNVGPLTNVVLRLVSPLLLSPAKGVRSLVHLSTSPDVGHLNGTYWSGMRQPPLLPMATDRQAEERLWDLSLALSAHGA